MWEDSLTEGDSIHKQVGLGLMRELPDHGTLTKDGRKPGYNVSHALAFSL